MELTRADVLAAAERIADKVNRTPVLTNPVLDEVAGCQLFFKAECLQRIGAFKARGALHAVGRLPESDRSRGIITYSSGNHAQAVALAAKTYGVRADIAMPEDAPPIKVERVKALGAHVVFAGTTSDDRKTKALAIQAERGGTIIEPFDHPDTICGQGTATLELLQETEAMGAPLDALVVPVGGGGLIAGACLACEGTEVRIHAVEPEGCDALRRSLEAGERIAVQPRATIADGLKPVMVGAQNFAIAQGRVAGAHLVTDAEIGIALCRILLRLKILVEPSGAASTALALRGLPDSPKRVGVILSGGNVDAGRVRELLETYGDQA